MYINGVQVFGVIYVYVKVQEKLWNGVLKGRVLVIIEEELRIVGKLFREWLGFLGLLNNLFVFI